jgi:hypothetical protein
MRPYIVRHLLGIGGAAVIVMVLWWGWSLYDGVAQVDDVADGDVLTVGQCIEADAASVDPLEEVLINEDLIEEDLLQKEVTNVMCEDILEGVADGTLVQKLAAAQNYIQEIDLIKGAMREAAGEVADEAAAKGTDWHFSSDEPLILFRAIVHTSEQVPAQAQYDGNDGVPPRTQQAAAAASVGEDDDAPLAETFRQKETALKREGASDREARAGALCGTELEAFDDKVKKDEGLYEIKPQIPKEMGHKETKQAGLLVSPLTIKRLRELRQEQTLIKELSESDIGCVVLTKRMKAKLVSLDFREGREALDIGRNHPDDIRKLSPNRDTIWGWKMTARQTGKLELSLHLHYEISREGEEFRRIPKTPVVKEIRVTPPDPDPWWQRILERIVGVFGA